MFTIVTEFKILRGIAVETSLRFSYRGKLKLKVYLSVRLQLEFFKKYFIDFKYFKYKIKVLLCLINYLSRLPNHIILKTPSIILKFEFFPPNQKCSVSARHDPSENLLRPEGSQYFELCAFVNVDSFGSNDPQMHGACPRLVNI